MPRKKKMLDLTASVLEMAHGKLNYILEVVSPITALRIAQAIQRHPDLKDLLEPMNGEVKEIQNAALIAKTEIRTAIKLVSSFHLSRY